MVYKTLDIKSTQIAHSPTPPKKIAQLSHSYTHVYTLLMGRWPGLYCDLSSLHTQKQWHESSPCPRRRWEEFLSSRVISAKVIPKNPQLVLCWSRQLKLKMAPTSELLFSFWVFLPVKSVPDGSQFRVVGEDLPFGRAAILGSHPWQTWSDVHVQGLKGSGMQVWTPTPGCNHTTV